MSANKNFVRGTLCVLLFWSIAGAAALLAEPCEAREDPLQDAITTLANEVLAIRDLHGPLQIDWRNDSSLSAAQSAALQSQFSARLSAIRGLISEDAAASPLLRVTLQETPAQFVAIARVSTAGGEQVRIVQVSRSAFAVRDTPQTTPSLQKQLLWKQREPILDAVEHSAGTANVLLVLGRDTLWAYSPAQDPLEWQGVAHISGAVRPSRALSGRIRFPKEEDSHFLLELPGKACSGSLAEKIALECASVEQRGSANAKGRSASPSSDSAKLVAPCDSNTWILSPGDGDWSKPDRLSLHDSRNAASERTTAIETPGPVLALTSGPGATSSIGVVLNLSTGEYEIYRFTLACHN